LLAISILTVGCKIFWRALYPAQGVTNDFVG